MRSDKLSVKTILKNKHYAIIRRLFKDKEKVKNLSYGDSSISEEWKDFENFRKWAIAQIGHQHSDWHIDKDILIKGNKIYSADTCCFIPLRINILFTSRKAGRGDYPLGVCKSSNGKSYTAQSRDGKRKVHLGTYSNPEDAFYAYKTYKENLIKLVANEYKGIIADNVYEALINYKIEITD